MVDTSRGELLGPDHARQRGEVRSRGAPAEPVAGDPHTSAPGERQRPAARGWTLGAPEVVLPAVGRDDRHVTVAAPGGPRAGGNPDAGPRDRVMSPVFRRVERVERIAGLGEVDGMAVVRARFGRAGDERGGAGPLPPAPPPGGPPRT